MDHELMEEKYFVEEKIRELEKRIEALEKIVFDQNTDNPIDSGDAYDS